MAEYHCLDMTDAALVQQVLAGNRAAFDQLVDRHAASGLRYATRMLGDRHDAEEVAQEAWLRTYRALAQFDPQSVFRTWFFAILINRCRTAMAARVRRERVIHLDDATLRAAADPGDSDSTALRLELQRAIARLPTDQREAFLLKHVEQMEYGDMTLVVGASIPALKMRVQRACQQLRLELREYQHER